MTSALWSVWWVWIVAGFGLGVLEVFAPGYIFLGFALGAVATGLLMLLGVGSLGLAPVLLIFAVLSLVAWLVLRRLVGKRPGQVKIWHSDINDNPPR